MKKLSAILLSSLIIGSVNLTAFSATDVDTRANQIMAVSNQKTKFALPKLGYSYSALEPYIDAATMKIHYTKHHQKYVDELNKAITTTDKSAKDMTLKEIVTNVSKFSPAVRNNAGGHWNHSFFWNIMTAKSKVKAPSKTFTDAVNKSFGSMDKMKQQFNDAGAKRFGSGWAWLIKKTDGTLAITSTANQDNPLMDIAEVKGMPILGCDVWEHAYYLKYQNKRPDYLKAFWNVVDWEVVEKLYNAK